MIKRLVTLLPAAVLSLSILGAHASVTVTGAAGGSAISADKAADSPTPAWTTLGPITINENAVGDFAAGTNVTLVLKTPAGFEFNAAAAPNVSFTTNRNITSASAAVTDSRNITITLTISGNNLSDTLTIGNVAGIQVRPVAASPLATGNHLFRPSTGGGSAIISGVVTSVSGSSGSDFGALTEVGGAVASFVFVDQLDDGTAGVAFTNQPSVLSIDQFGNFSTNGLLPEENVFLTLISGAGPLQGTTVTNIGMNGARGQIVFSDLRIDVAGNDKQLMLSSTNGVFGDFTTVFSIFPAAFHGLQVLTPGETSAPGTVSGKSGTPATQSVGTQFGVTVNAVDAFWNLIATNDTVHLCSSDTNAVLSADAALSAGTHLFNITPMTAGSTTVTASNATHAIILSNTSSPIPVIKGNQTITFAALPNKTYGDPQFGLAATASSALPVTFSVVSGPATITGTNVTITAAGLVTIRASQAGDANWNAATNVDRSFTVLQAALTVSAVNQSRAYGSINPLLTASYTGFTNGDGTNVLSGSPLLSTSADTNSPVGQYTITISQGTLAASNYSFGPFVSGTLSVTQAVLTVSANNKTRTYGALNPIFTASYTGFVNGQNTNILSGTPALNTVAQTNSPIGTYPIVITQGTLVSADTNYVFAFVNGTLTNNSAALSVTADPKSRTYGALNPTFTGVIVGIQNNEPLSATYSTVANTNSPIGIYAIVPAMVGTTLTNYSITTNAGILTVSPAPLSFTADNATRDYGVTNPIFTGVILGIQNNDAISATYLTAATQASPVGTYAIVPAPAGTLTNYTVASTNGTLTINKSTLTVTAGDTYRQVNKPNPVFTASYSGFLNGDTTNVLSGAPDLSTAAATNSPPGAYPIVVAQGTLNATNYNFAFVNGTLTIFSGTNVYDFTYADRTAFLADGWSFIAKNPDGTPRNTEITDTNIGGVVSYAQTNSQLGMVTRVPADVGYLWGTPLTVPDSVPNLAPDPLANQTRNSMFRSLPTNWVSMRLKFAFTPNANFHQIIMMAYQDDDNYVETEFTYNTFLQPYPFNLPGPTAVTTDREFYGFPARDKEIYTTATNLILRMDRLAGSDDISSMFSEDGGTNWIPVMQVKQVLTNAQFGIVIGGAQSTFPLSNLPSVDLSQAVILTSDTYTSPPPTLVLQPQHLVFNATAGSSCVATQRVNIVDRNVNTPTAWTLSNSVPWIIASTNAGQTPGFCNFSVDTTGLAPGTYNGAAIVTMAGPTNSPQSVAITLIVNPAGRANVALWKDSRPAAMSVSVDDGGSTGYNEMVADGVKGSFLLWHNSAPQFYNDAYANGMEVGCHTLNHCCFGLHNAAMYREFESSLKALLLWVPITRPEINSFAWPCGFTTPEEEAIASQYFLVARGYSINQLEDPTPNDMMNVKSFNSHEHEPFPPADFKTIVDAAIAQGKWYNMVLHLYLTDDGAIAYASTNNIWVAPLGTVSKYILQRDRTVITNYLETTNSIQFSAYRLPLDPSPLRSFEAALQTNDLLTLQVDVTGMAAVNGLTVDGVSTPYTNRVVSGRTLLCFNTVVTTNAQSVNVNVTRQYLLTVTANNTNRSYGQTNPLFTGTLTGVQPGHNITATFTSSATTNSPIGTYAIRPVFSDPNSQLTNYFITTNLGVLTITPSPLTVAANSKSKTYGDLDPALTFSITNGALANGDTLSGALTRAAGEIAASYAINQGTLSAGTNYSMTFFGSTLTINKRPLTIAANNLSRAYGLTNPPLTVSYIGFAFSDDPSALAGTPGVNTSAQTNSPVGPYTISVTLGSMPSIQTNYSVTLSNGTLTVNRALLNVVANNQTKFYGATNPVLTASYTGFVNNETTNVLSGQPSLSTTATTNSTPGTYPIAITNGTLAANNYSFAFANGSLTVNAAALVPNVGISNKIYDGTIAAVITNRSLIGVVGTDDVTLVGGIASFANKNVGSSKTVITTNLTLSGTQATNYVLASTSATNTANITARALTVTATGSSRPYDGTTNASVTLSDNRVAGDILSVGYTNASFVSKHVGTNKTINVSGITVTNTDASNYTFNASAVATANITALPITVSALTATKTYDGTSSSAIIPSISSGAVAAGDTAGFAQQYDNKNVGTGKTLNPIGAVLDGNAGSNYVVTLVSTNNGVINSASLTPHVAVASKPYDGTVTALITNRTLTGVISPDSVSLIGGTATFADANVGTSKLVTAIGLSLSGTDATNYTLVSSNATTSADILQAQLLVAANNAARSYGATNPTFSVSYTGFIGSENQSVLSGQPNLSTTATTNSPVGTYPITAALGSLSATNYSFAFSNGTLTVGQALLTVAANNQTKFYGATNPILTVSYTGFVNNDTTNVLSGLPNLSTTATTNSPVGTYPITATLGSLSATNYSFALSNGTLTVNQALLLVVANNQNKVYGTTNPVLTATYAGFVNNETTNVLSGQPNLSTTATTNSPVGTYPITAALGTLAATNYSFAFSNGTLTVNQALLTVAANNQSKVYGATNPVLTATYTGFVNNETTNVLSGQPNLSTTATTNSSVGTYPITAASGTLIATNYSLAFSNGLLTVNAASLVPHIGVSNRIYDGTIAAVITNRSLTGVVGSDDVSLVGGIATFADKNVGTSKSVVATNLILSGAQATNYVLASASTTNTADISPASLQIVADHKVKAQGLANPTLTATYFGFVAGEGTNVLGTQPTLNTSATIGSPAGTYPITASGALALNYSISYVDGVLTVVAPPSLDLPQASGNQIYFNVPTVAGVNYQLESASTLPGPWTPVGSPIPGTGSSISMTNTMTGPVGFMRVRILP